MDSGVFSPPLIRPSGTFSNKEPSPGLSLKRRGIVGRRACGYRVFGFELPPLPPGEGWGEGPGTNLPLLHLLQSPERHTDGYRELGAGLFQKLGEECGCLRLSERVSDTNFGLELRLCIFRKTAQ